ncbi:MAG: alpha/beta-type small acid-soluble spore protein [Bacillota bacterium]|nr:MAG: alpha/beta-type small acid-soluble spore protein [Bacillota bacterium]
MGQGQRSNRILVRGAEHALDQFKYEIAREIGLTPPPDGYWGEYPTRQCGAMGGHMVRRMIQDAELRLAGGGGLTNVGGFTGGGYVGGGFGGGFAGGGVGGYTTR